MSSPKRRTSKSKKKNKNKKNNGPNLCEIDYRILPIAKLKQACRGQFDLNGPKCYKNMCSKVTGVLSTDSNYLGNVVLITDPENPDQQLVVKWNRFSENREKMLYELKLQNIAYALGLAPKIIEAYEDGNYFFITMTNLIKKGYRTVYDLFVKKIVDKYWNEEGNLDNLFVPEEVLELIGKGLSKLHTEHIAHRDLHPRNVFYNPDTHKIMFIDFGAARKYGSIEEATMAEKFDFTYVTKTAEGIHNTLPHNWINIINYY